MKSIPKLLTVVSMVVAILCVLVFVRCSPSDDEIAEVRQLELSADPGHKRFDWEAWEREREERWAREEAEAEEQRRILLEEEANLPPPKRRVRRVRRFEWRSPAETRGEIWNIPEEESEQAVLTAFLRICIAEADGHPQDCVGIWQVFQNIRRRSCSRDYVRRITECDEGGETLLSVMRRAQPHIMGVVPLRNQRAAWIRNLETDCDPPEGWTGSENQWDASYGSRCQHAVQLGRALIAGDPLPQRPGHRISFLPNRPITWGGRCESGRGSCDDSIACSRGLNRIPDTDTHNAFWCRPGANGCPEDIDPVCQQYRQGHVPSTTPVASSEDEREEEPLGG